MVSNSDKSGKMKRYCILEEMDIIEEGDEFYCGTWEIVPPSAVGAHWTWSLYPCRRKKK